MACLRHSNLDSTALAACIPHSRLHSYSFRTPNYRPSFTLAQLPEARARGRVRGIRSEGNRPHFEYTRAKPEVRWPHKSDELLQQRIARQSESASRPRLPDWDELSCSDAELEEEEEAEQYVASNRETVPVQREKMDRQREAVRQRQKGQARRLQSISKLALRKVADVKNKARRLSNAICSLELPRPVADVLDAWPEQMSNGELSVVVRNVGDQNWQRALELYEWLNHQHWYTPNPRLLATMLHILGRANQLEAARELFVKADPQLSSCIQLLDEQIVQVEGHEGLFLQVFNAILGVYAKQGQWDAVEQILELTEQRGCEPDITTFNTIANARCKCDLQPGMASAILKEIERAGLRPDIITYNTLLSGCIASKNVTEAAEIIKEMEQRGFDLDGCTSYVLGKKYLSLGEDESSVSSTLDETLQQHTFSNDLQDDGTLQKTGTLVFEGNMSRCVRPNMNCIESRRLQARDSRKVVAPYTRSPESVCRPADESRLSMICLFMQWKATRATSAGDQSLRFGQGIGSTTLGGRNLRYIHSTGWGDSYITNVRVSYERAHLCKIAQVPLPRTEQVNLKLSDVGQSDTELVRVAMHETSVDTANASSCTKLINDCMMKKDYPSGLERLTEMVEAGIEPGYMTWICILQACGQSARRIDLLRLLAALRDAGCPLPLRLIMEREAPMAEVEDWFRYLQTSSADAGQGMVNVLVDILWAFKLRATAGHVYNLAVRLDMYPRNFARVEEQNWEADFRSLSPGTALVALNHWFIEMQKASLDGFPESPKEVLLITGTQGYQNGVSLNKTIRAHLWEMGSPFYMRPPREGALISKGHALRLWLKDSPRCFNLDLDDDVRLPESNSMSSFQGAWMSSDAVPVMKQIHASLGEVWPRRYSKLAHVSETRRIEALAGRIENEKRRRVEKREKNVQPSKKKRPLRRK